MKKKVHSHDQVTWIQADLKFVGWSGDWSNLFSLISWWLHVNTGVEIIKKPTWTQASLMEIPCNARLCKQVFYKLPWLPEVFLEKSHEAARREEKRERWENLWWAVTVDWSYRANSFELESRSDPASWLEEPYKCTLIGSC